VATGPEADGSITDGNREVDPEAALRDVADQLWALIDELEPTLDAGQRRLLHQIRLVAETYGLVRATVDLYRARRRSADEGGRA
jgi:hypothetical protein